MACCSRQSEIKRTLVGSPWSYFTCKAIASGPADGADRAGGADLVVVLERVVVLHLVLLAAEQVAQDNFACCSEHRYRCQTNRFRTVTGVCCL